MHGNPQPGGLTEDSPLVTESADAYVATKARAELALAEVSSRGLPTTAVRPGAICSVVRSRWGDDLVTRLRAAGRTYIAVDRCVAIGDYLGPIITALGGPIAPPDRKPTVSRCRIGRIRDELGYRPRRTFEQTVQTLAG